MFWGRFPIFFANRDFHLILNIVSRRRGKKRQDNNTACKKSHLVSYELAETSGTKPQAAQQDFKRQLKLQQAILSLMKKNIIFILQDPL